MVNHAHLPAPFGTLPRKSVARQKLRAGETLFRQGDRPRALFLVVSGALRLLRHTEAGAQVQLFEAHPGDTLAEASLFSDHYHCDCVARHDSTVLALDKAEILRHLRADPDFASTLLARMSGQVQFYRRRLELLAIGSAKDRVLAGLADGWLTGSVMDFASSLGLSHEATYRALTRLVQEGRAAKTGRGRYIATDQPQRATPTARKADP